MVRYGRFAHRSRGASAGGQKAGFEREPRSSRGVGRDDSNARRLERITRRSRTRRATARRGPAVVGFPDVRGAYPRLIVRWVRITRVVRHPRRARRRAADKIGTRSKVWKLSGACRVTHRLGLGGHELGRSLDRLGDDSAATDGDLAGGRGNGGWPARGGRAPR